MGIILGLTLLNLVISWFNARACGLVWAESKALGGFIRLVVWSAAVMSAIGFSSVYLLGLVAAAAAYLGPETDEARALVQYASAYWYVAVVIPVLCTGLIITIHSWIEAYREPGLLNVGIAGWNTYAQLHNAAGAVDSLGPAMKVVGEGIGEVFSGDGDGKGKVALLALVLVVLALSAGALTTAVIIKRYEGTLPVPEWKEA